MEHLIKTNLMKMEKRLKYLMLLYFCHSNVNLRTIHSFYIMINGYVNDTARKSNVTLDQQDGLENRFWERAERVQANFIKEVADKDKVELSKSLKKKDVLSFTNSKYLKFPKPNQLNDQFEKYRQVVLGVVKTLKDSNDKVQDRKQQIIFFHCLEKLCSKMLGAGMIYFWSLYFNVDSGLDYQPFTSTSNIPKNLSMTEVNEFIKGKTCLLCNKMKPRKHETNNDTLKQHLKNCHDIMELKCVNCGVSFTCSKNLLEHMKKIHKAPIFVCKLCPEKFKSKAALMVHVQDDHHQKNVVIRGKDSYMAHVEALRNKTKSNEIQLADATLGTNIGFMPTGLPEWRKTMVKEVFIGPATIEQLRFYSFEELVQRDLKWQTFVQKSSVLQNKFPPVFQTNEVTMQDAFNSISFDIDDESFSDIDSVYGDFDYFSSMFNKIQASSSTDDQQNLTCTEGPVPASFQGNDIQLDTTEEKDVKHTYPDFGDLITFNENATDTTSTDKILLERSNESCFECLMGDSTKDSQDDWWKDIDELDVLMNDQVNNILKRKSNTCNDSNKRYKRDEEESNVKLSPCTVSLNENDERWSVDE